MPLWKNTQHAFIAGQLDANVMGRQDMDRYFKGATLLKNFLVKRQGCISKRRGTDLTADLDGLLGTTYDGDPITPGKMRLVPVTNGDDGRYVIFSGGLAFVADRNGLLTTDRRRVRTVPSYVGRDEYGRKTISGGNDRMHNPSTPIEVIHAVAPGVYANTRHVLLSDAFAAAKDGDTIRLHDDIMMSSRNGWVSDSGSSLSMSYDRTTRKWTTTYGSFTRVSDEVDESADVAYFSSVPFTAYRLQLIQPGFGVKSDIWSFSDGGNWTISRENNAWKITDGTHTHTTSTGNADSVTVTIPTVQVTATRTDSSSTEWSFSDSGAWTCAYEFVQLPSGGGAWAWHLYREGESYIKTGVAQSATSVTFDTATVTCTRERKHLTLDLYGYTITVDGATSAISMNVNMDLKITSQRVGAKVVTLQNGNWGAFTANNLASITVDGDIKWECLASTQGSFLRSLDTGILTINSGTFERKVAGTAGLIQFAYASGSPGGVINGGTFKGIAKQTGSTYSTYNNYLIGCGIVTVNGGEFFMDAPDDELSRIFDNGNYSGLTLNGGRFKTSGCKFFTRANNTTGFNVVRGQFSSASGMAENVVGLSGNTLADIMESGSELNAAQPDADGCYGVHGEGEGDYAWAGIGYNRTIYRIAVPYEDDDLADLCIRQSGDTLFIAHRNYPPAKITFDSYGFAFFDEITFDNTDYNPPKITSAVMEGQEPKETTWPSGFDSTLKADAKSRGTVTDAGMNSNSSSGSDGSSQSATTWQATVEHKDRTNGKKTVTTIVKSSTSSVAIEKNRIYQNGLVVAETDVAISTSGTAQNEASATSVLVTRTVRYVATYVKNGKESRPSVPVAIDYDMPWANNAVVKLTLAKGSNDTEPDYYNVYKDNGNGYGLIATTGTEKAITTLDGYIDTYNLYMPSANTTNLQNVYDWEDAKGWTAGSVIGRILSGQQKNMTGSTTGDVSLICTSSDVASGIVLDLTGENVKFKAASVSLDGRMYDAANDVCYLIPSYSRVRCTITYVDTDGAAHTAYKVTQPSKKFGSHGAVSYLDWPAKWQGKARAYFTAPNGDTVMGLLLGEGDQSELFNETMRRLTFDFSDVYSSIDHVTKVVFTFTDTYYSDWINTSTQRQGVIRGITFTNSTLGTAASTADVEDDYINPDMTVTPPDDSQDPHFGETDEYPGCVGIYDQRLVFASTRNSPSTIWMSRIADLYNFTVHDSIREDDALELTLAATEFPNINHLVMGRDLMLFGDGGEWLISPVQGNALTYKTASAKLQSMIGSDRALQPLQLADETLFAERGGTCLRTINYNYASDSYQSQDLSVIAQSLFRANQIVSMAYKQHPDSIVECVLADGRVATLVYMKEQDVAAWSVQELGGGWKAREIASPKCIVNGTTAMMLLVEKSGAFQLWKVRDDDDAMTDASQVILDGMHIETDSAPTGTGEQGVALGDGTYAIGWPVESEFVSIRPEPEKGQTAQMEIKNSTETEIRVTDATTFSVKPFDASSGWRYVNLPVVRSGANVTLSAKDCKRLMTGTNSRDGRIHLKHTEPWPLTILSISTTYQVEYENGTGEGGQ